MIPLSFKEFFMKGICKIFSICAMSILLLFGGVYFSVENSSTEQNLSTAMPVGISTAEALADVARSLANDSSTFKKADITLNNDIDLGGKIWMPIGASYKNGFEGTFNGNGYTISNLTIDESYTNGFVGLFGYSNATIYNFRMTNVYISSKSSFVGAVCGYAPGGTISNVYVDGFITNSSSDSYTAGIVGYTDGSVFACQNAAAVTSTSRACGIGMGRINGCINNGTVYGKSKEDSYPLSNEEVYYSYYNCNIFGSVYNKYIKECSNVFNQTVKPYGTTINTTTNLSNVFGKTNYDRYFFGNSNQPVLRGVNNTFMAIKDVTNSLGADLVDYSNNSNPVGTNNISTPLKLTLCSDLQKIANKNNEYYNKTWETAGIGQVYGMTTSFDVSLQASTISIAGCDYGNTVNDGCENRTLYSNSFLGNESFQGRQVYLVFAFNTQNMLTCYEIDIGYFADNEEISTENIFLNSIRFKKSTASGKVYVYKTYNSTNTKLEINSTFSNAISYSQSIKEIKIYLSDNAQIYFDAQVVGESGLRIYHSMKVGGKFIDSSKKVNNVKYTDDFSFKNVSTGYAGEKDNKINLHFSDLYGININKNLPRAATDHNYNGKYIGNEETTKYISYNSGKVYDSKPNTLLKAGSDLLFKNTPTIDGYTLTKVTFEYLKEYTIASQSSDGLKIYSGSNGYKEFCMTQIKKAGTNGFAYLQPDPTPQTSMPTCFCVWSANANRVNINSIVYTGSEPDFNIKEITEILPFLDNGFCANADQHFIRYPVAQTTINTKNGKVTLGYETAFGLYNTSTTVDTTTFVFLNSENYSSMSLNTSQENFIAPGFEFWGYVITNPDGNATSSLATFSNDAVFDDSATNKISTIGKTNLYHIHGDINIYVLFKPISNIEIELGHTNDSIDESEYTVHYAIANKYETSFPTEFQKATIRQGQKQIVTVNGLQNLIILHSGENNLSMSTSNVDYGFALDQTNNSPLLSSNAQNGYDFNTNGDTYWVFYNLNWDYYNKQPETSLYANFKVVWNNILLDIEMVDDVGYRNMDTVFQDDLSLKQSFQPVITLNQDKDASQKYEISGNMKFRAITSQTVLTFEIYNQYLFELKNLESVLIKIGDTFVNGENYFDVDIVSNPTKTQVVLKNFSGLQNGEYKIYFVLQPTQYSVTLSQMNENDTAISKSGETILAVGSSNVPYKSLATNNNNGIATQNITFVMLRNEKYEYINFVYNIIPKNAKIDFDLEKLYVNGSGHTEQLEGNRYRLAIDDDIMKQSFDRNNKRLVLKSIFEVLYNKELAVSIYVQNANDEEYSLYSGKIGEIPSGEFKLTLDAGSENGITMYTLNLTDENANESTKTFKIGAICPAITTDLLNNIFLDKEKTNEENNQNIFQSATSLTGFSLYFSRNNYDIKYYDTNGNNLATEQKPYGFIGYTIGISDELKNQLSKTGYEFVAWNTYKNGNGNQYSEGDVFGTITANVEFYPVYQPKTYTATWNAEGITDSGQNSLFAADDVSFSWTNKSGYTVYEQQKYATSQVVYDNNYGVLGGVTYTKLITPSKAGYTFLGWSTVKQNDINSTMPNNTRIDYNTKVDITQNSTFYAWWSASTIDVKFDKVLKFANNPVPSTINYNISGTFGTLPTIADITNANNVTYYQFVGWYRTSDYSGKSVTVNDTIYNHDEIAPTESITLYAKWKLVGFEFKKHSNGYYFESVYNGQVQETLRFTTQSPALTQEISILDIEYFEVATITKQWKNPAGNNCGTSDVLSLTNVSQSGQYDLIISMTYLGETVQKNANSNNNEGIVSILPAQATIKFDKNKTYDGTTAVKNLNLTFDNAGLNGFISIRSGDYFDSNNNAKTANVAEAKTVLFELNSDYEYSNFAIFITTTENDKFSYGTLTRGTINLAGLLECNITPYLVELDIGNQSSNTTNAIHKLTVSDGSDYFDNATNRLLRNNNYTLKQLVGSSYLDSANVYTSGADVGMYYPVEVQMQDKVGDLLLNIYFIQNEVDRSSNFNLKLKSTNTYEITRPTAYTKTLVIDKTQNLIIVDENFKRYSFDTLTKLYDIEVYYNNRKLQEDIWESQSSANFYSYITQSRDTITITLNSDTAILEKDANLELRFVSALQNVGTQTYLWVDDWGAKGPGTQYNFGTYTKDNQNLIVNMVSGINGNSANITPLVRNFANITLDKYLKNAQNTTNVNIDVLRRTTDYSINLREKNGMSDTDYQSMFYETNLALGGFNYNSGIISGENFVISSKSIFKNTTLTMEWKVDVDGIEAVWKEGDNSQTSINYSKTYNALTTYLDFSILGRNNNSSYPVGAVEYLWKLNNKEIGTGASLTSQQYKDVVNLQNQKMSLTISAEKSNGVVLSGEVDLTYSVVINPFEVSLANDIFATRKIEKIYDRDDVIKEGENNFILFDIELGSGTIESLTLSGRYYSSNVGEYLYDNSGFINLVVKDYNEYKQSNYLFDFSGLRGQILPVEILIEVGERAKDYDGQNYVYIGEYQGEDISSTHKIVYEIETISSDMGKYIIPSDVDISFYFATLDGKQVVGVEKNYDVSFVGELQIALNTTDLDNFEIENLVTTFDNNSKSIFVTPLDLPSGVDVVYTWQNRDDVSISGTYYHNKFNFQGNTGKYDSSNSNPNAFPILAGIYTVTATFVNNGNVQFSGNQTKTAQITIQKRNVTVQLANFVYENVAKYNIEVNSNAQDKFVFSYNTNQITTKPSDYVLSAYPTNFNQVNSSFSLTGLLDGFVLTANVYNDRLIQGAVLTNGNGLICSAQINFDNADYSANFNVVFANLSYKINHIYTVSFNSNYDGGVNTSRQMNFNAPLSFPVISREGYELVGWAVNKNETDTSKIYKIGLSELTNLAKHGETVEYFAIWEAGQTNVIVEFWTQSILDEQLYTLQTQRQFQNLHTESKIILNYISANRISMHYDSAVGTHITDITLANLGLEGFSFDQNHENQIYQIDSIQGNGNNIFKVFLTRNVYKITYWFNNTEPSQDVFYKFEQSVSKPQNPTLAGYSFEYWSYADHETNGSLIGLRESFESLTMPAQDLIIQANYKGDSNTKFIVEIVYQNLDNSYDEFDETVGAVNPNITRQSLYTMTGKYSNISINENGKSFEVSVYNDDNFDEVFAEFVPALINLNAGFTATSTGNILSGQVTVNGGIDMVDSQRYLLLRIFAQRDSYTITYHKNNGENNIQETYKFGEIIQEPNFEILKLGYEFVDWYENAELSVKYSFGGYMPANNFSLYAKWEAREVEWSLKISKQNYDNNEYTTEVVSQKSKTDSYVEIVDESGLFYLIISNNNVQISKTPIQIEGFSFVGSSGKTLIKGDNSTEFELRYNRTTSKINVYYNNGEATYTNGAVRYGTPLNEIGFNLSPKKLGYVFVGYFYDQQLTQTVNVNSTMPNQDIDIYAAWKNGVSQWKLESQIESLDGGYVQTLTEKTSTTNSVIQKTTQNGKNYLIILENSIEKERILLDRAGFTIVSISKNNEEFTQGIIADDGQTQIVVKYDRNLYNLNINYNYIRAGEQDFYTETKTYKYEQPIDSLTSPTRQGYRFVDWYTEIQFKNTFAYDIMPSNDILAIAKWEESTAGFVLRYNFERLTDEAGAPIYDNLVAENKTIEAITGNSIVLEGNVLRIKSGDIIKKEEGVKTFAGFNRITNTINAVVNSDGSTIVDINFERLSYSFDVNYNNGTQKFSTTVKFEKLLDDVSGVDKAPTQTGYLFEGWFADINFETSFDFNSTMPANDLEIYAKWTPSIVGYKLSINTENTQGGIDNVVHTFEAINQNTVIARLEGNTIIVGEYNGSTLVKNDFELEILQGLTLQTDLPLQVVIGADGNTTINISIARNSYNLIYNYGNTQQNSQSSIKFQSALVKPQDPEYTGYDFAGWFEDQAKTIAFVWENSTMPARDLTLYAKWNPADGTPFKVEYYKMDINGEYPTVADTVNNFVGVTNNEVKIENGKINFYDSGTLQDGQSIDLAVYEGFSFATHSSQILQITISASGDSVLKVYYSRNQYNVNIYYNNDTEDKVLENIYYEQYIDEQSPTKTGFIFDGWYTTYNFEQASKITLPYKVMSNTNIYAKWQAGSVTFKIMIFAENVADSNYSVVSTRTILGATTLNTIKAQITDKTILINEYNGSTFIKTHYSYNVEQGFEILSTSGETIINADSSAAFEINLSRNSYTLTYIYNNGENNLKSIIKYQTPIQKPANPIKEGYTFEYWDNNGAFNFTNSTMPASDLTLSAIYSPNQNTEYIVEYYFEELSGEYQNQAGDKSTFVATTDYYAQISAGEVLVKENAELQNIYKKEQLKEFKGFSYDYSNTNNVLQGIIASESKKLTLKIYLTRNNYNLTINYKDLNESQPLVTSYKFGSTITEIQIIKNSGFEFENWYYDKSYEDIVTFPFVIDDDIQVYAKWVLATDTALVINKHYETLTSGEYLLEDVETAGTTYSTVEIEQIENVWVVVVYNNNLVESRYEFARDGFELNQTKSNMTGISIVPDGSAQINVYLDRLSYQFTVHYPETDLTKNYKYQQEIELEEDATLVGYTFVGWFADQSKTLPFVFAKATMPAHNMDIYPNFEANSNTEFKVQYYHQNLDGDYDLFKTATHTGTSNFVLKIEDNKINVYNNETIDRSYDLDSFYGFARVSNPSEILNGIIKPNGSEILAVYYERNNFTITFVYNDNSTEDKVIQGKYQSVVEVAIPTRAGYDFAGWFENSALSILASYEITSTTHNFVVEKNISIYAKWEARTDTKYITNYYQQNANDDNYALFETVTNEGVTDRQAEAVIKSYIGFAFEPNNANNQLTGNISATQTLVLNVYYTRNSYSIVFNANGGNGEMPTQSFRYMQSQNISANAFSRAGFEFAGWTTKATEKVVVYANNQSYVMEQTENINLYALWNIQDNLSVQISTDKEHNTTAYGNNIVVTSAVSHSADLDYVFEWFLAGKKIANSTAELVVQERNQSGIYQVKVTANAKDTTGAIQSQIEAESNQIMINITKRDVALEFTNTEFVYNGLSQIPEFEFVMIGEIERSDLIIPTFVSTITANKQIVTSSINAGNYNIKISYQDENYNLTGNDNFDYTISAFDYDINSLISKGMFSKFFNQEDSDLILPIVYETTGESLQVFFDREQGEDIGFYNIMLKTPACSSVNFNIMPISAENQGFEIKIATSTIVELGFIDESLLQKIFDGNNISNTEEAFALDNLKTSPQATITSVSFVIRNNSANVGSYRIVLGRCTTLEYQNIILDKEYYFTINTRSLTYNGQTVEKVYDGTDTYNGLLTNDIVSIDGTTKLIASFADVNADSNIKINFILSGENSSNYSLSEDFDSIYGSITPRNVKVLPEEKTLIYGEFNQNTDISYTLKAQNENGEYVLNVDQTQFGGKLSVENADKYRPNVYQIVQGTLQCSTGNYQIDSINSANIEIIQKQISCVGEYNKYYDGNDSVLSQVVLEGVLQGDDVVAVAKYSQAEIGDNILVNISLSGADADCYILQNSTATGSISYQIVSLNLDYGFDRLITDEHSTIVTSSYSLIYNKTISESLDYYGYSQLPTPTATGWVFNGWWTEIDGGIQYTNDTIINNQTFGEPDSEKTVYARWSYGDLRLQVVVISYSTTEYLVEKMDGHLLGGTFTINGQNYNDYGNVQTLTFNDIATIIPIANDGYEFVGYFAGPSIDSPKIEESEIYEFDGTTLKIKMQTNQIVYLKFKLKSNGITLNLNADSNVLVKNDFSNWTIEEVGSIKQISKDFDLGTEVILPTDADISRTGYQFMGWAYSQTAIIGNIEKVVVDGPIVLYAVWKPIEYKLVLNANTGNENELLLNSDKGKFDDGSAQKVLHIPYNTRIGELPVPTRIGFEFKQWVDSNNNIWTDETIYSYITDNTLYAEWKEKSIIVRLQVTPAMKDITVLQSAGILSVNSQIVGNAKVWTIMMMFTSNLTINGFDAKGYKLSYDCQLQNGVDYNLDYSNDSGHQFVISRAKADFDFNINYLSDLHQYEFSVNDINLGYLSLEVNEKIENSFRATPRNDENIVEVISPNKWVVNVYSGETITLTATAMTGYKVKSYHIDTGSIADAENTKLISQIYQNGTALVEFDALANNVSIRVGTDITNNESNNKLGYIQVYKVDDEDKLLTVEQQTLANLQLLTDEKIKIVPVANQGFKTIFDSQYWVWAKSNQNGWQGKFEIFADEGYVLFSNYNCDGEIVVPFTRELYTINTSLGYYEDGSFTQISENIDEYITVTSLTSSDGTKDMLDAYYYETNVSLQMQVIKEGYEFLGWYSALEPSSILGQGDKLNIALTQDTEIYAVIRLKSMTVSYETEGSGIINPSRSQQILFGRDCEPVTAEAMIGYEFVKWQIYDNENSIWIDDEQNATTTRVDTNITQNLRVRAVFVASEITIHITTKLYIDYDERHLAIEGTMSTEIGHINQVGKEEKLLEVVINTKTGEVINLYGIVHEGYNIMSWLANDNTNHARINFADMSNVVVSGFVADFEIEVIFEANLNNFEISFAEYNESVIPSTTVPAGAIIVNPENFLASQNYQSVVYANARTNKKFTVSANIIVGYECVADQNNAYDIKVGILYNNQSTMQYIENVKLEQLIGIYGQKIEFEVSEFLDDAKIFIFVNLTRYDVRFYLTDDIVFDYKLTINSAFNELSDEVKLPARTGYFFLGWYSQINGNGLQYIDENGRVMHNWSIEHKSIYANWQTAYVTYNIIYVPDTNAMASSLGWDVRPNVLHKAVSNHILQYYVNNEFVLNAPASNPDYQFSHWIINQEKFDTKDIVIYIPENTTEFEQDIYIYYKVKMSVIANAGGTASLNGGLKEIYMGEGDASIVHATPNEGYVFKGWSLLGDNKIISTSMDLDISYNSNPQVYVANFEGKTTQLVINSVSHGTVTSFKVNGLDVVEQDGKIFVRLGDVLTFVTQATNGYYLTGWTVNDVYQSPFNSWTVSTNDVKQTSLEFTPIFSLATITYIVQYDNVSGTVKHNNSNITSGMAMTTSYAGTVELDIVLNTRYKINKLLINGIDLTENYMVETLEGFKVMFASSIFNITQRNTVEITFEKIYWLDFKLAFDGLGTEAYPYKIMSAENFAMMCYLINNNIEVDAPNKVNYKVAYYVLSSAVDFEKAFWVPIGTEQNPFDGIMQFEYERTNIFLDKDYPITHYEGLFGYISEYAKFIDSTKTYQTAIIIVCGFVGVLLIITIIFIILKSRKKKNFERKSSTIVLMPPKKPKG